MSKCQGHHHKTDLPKILEQLKSSGLRLTRQRALMAEAILKLGRPFTSEELYDRVLKLAPRDSLDLATVYRSMAKFFEAGLVTTCHFGDGILRYELRPMDGSHHHHIICKVCHQVEALDECLVQAYESSLKKKGYSNISHKLEFFGICQSCVS